MAKKQEIITHRIRVKLEDGRIYEASTNSTGRITEGQSVMACVYMETGAVYFSTTVFEIL